MTAREEKGREMNATHEVRKFLDGCEGSGKIVATGTYAECRNAKRRLERKAAECFSFAVCAVGAPDGSQYTYSQDGRKVHQPGF